MLLGCGNLKTSFAYVIRPHELRKSTRSSSSKSISRAYEAFQSGETDVLQFMNILHRLRNEELSGKQERSWQRLKRQAVAQEAGSEEMPDEQDRRLSLEEYLKGRESYRRPATGGLGILSVNDASYADLVDILRTASFGLLQAHPKDVPETQPDAIFDDEKNVNSELAGVAGQRESDDDVLVETEGDEEAEETDTEKDYGDGPEDGSDAEQEYHADRAIEKLRNKLVSETHDFSQALRESAKAGDVPSQMALLFWLHLLTLVLGIREEFGKRVLSTTNEEHSESYFPRLTAALLRFFYTYPKPSAFQQLSVDEAAGALPDDIFDLYAFSLWCCCLSVAVDRLNNGSELSELLSTVSRNVYRTVAGASGSIDADALGKRIEQLNKAQQGLPVSTEVIHEIHREFMSVLG